MGGDWYEVIPLDDGSAVVVVGDVIGHGVEAIAAMAQLQYLVAGLLRSDTPLGAVFARTTAMIQADSPLYATAQLLHVDPAHSRLGYLNAGHPWALLRRPDGSVERLDQAKQSLIGVHLEPTPLTYVELVPGSLLLAYSDGLVERRYETITDSIDRLVGLVRDLDPRQPLARTLERLVECARQPDARGGPLNDDVVAVLITCEDEAFPAT
jgi:serine phosphatase RsbU (regulator of sigma subunit)